MTRKEIEKRKRDLADSAPLLLKACEAQHEAIDRLFALLIQKDRLFFPSRSGQPWEALKKGAEAIHLAGGKI